MLRNVLILLVCGALVFAAVWKLAPDFLATIMPNQEAKAVDEQPPAPTVVKKHAPSKAAPEASAPKRLPVRVERSAEPLVAKEPAAEQLPALTPATAAELVNRSRRFRVASDGLALYSTNSPIGRVVKVLKDGDVLELQFKLEGPGQEWMFVSMADRRVSGFLPIDNTVLVD